MNLIDDQLKRLFRAAAQTNAEAIPSMPFGLETRVMAAWREARANPSGFWDLAVLVRGLILASVIMAVSFWPALNTSVTGASAGATSPFADFLQLTDSTVPSDEIQ